MICSYVWAVVVQPLHSPFNLKNRIQDFLVDGFSQGYHGVRCMPVALMRVYGKHFDAFLSRPG